MDTEKTCTIKITDGDWGREIEVEADTEGLYLEGATIPWEWIDSVRQTVRPSAQESLVSCGIWNLTD